MKKSTAVGLGVVGVGLLWWGLASGKTAPAPQRPFVPSPEPPRPPPPTPTPVFVPPQAPHAAPADFVVPATVAQSIRDPLILWVQQAYNADSRLKSQPRLAEDGNWGPNTSHAVRLLQHDLGVNETGNLTEDLLSAIDLSDIPGDPRPIGPPPLLQAYPAYP